MSPEQPPPAFQRPEDARGSADEGEDVEGLGQVEAVHCHGDRRNGEDEAGDRAREDAEVAANNQPQEANGGGPGDGARQEKAGAGVAEDTREQRVDPEEYGWLIDGDEAAGVEGAEEEVVPALSHRAHGGGVVGVAVAGLRQSPDIEEQGDCKHGDEGSHVASWSRLIETGSDRESAGSSSL